MKELAAMAQKAADENEAFKEQLGAELNEAAREGKLSPEQMKKLAEAAKNSKESLAKSAKKLHDAKLIDPDQLKACEGGKCDADALAKYLAEKSGKGNGKNGDGKNGKNGDGKNGKNGDGAKGMGQQSADNRGKPSLKEGLRRQEGNGGVNDDGPGETPLDFGDRSTDAGAKFKEEALPPAELAALKESQLAGIGKAPPKVDPKAGPPKAGGLTGAATGGGSANTAPVLPQHRATVERYFDRK
jgi:hypothetical protein